MKHEKHCPLSLAYNEAGLGAEKCQGCKAIRAAVAGAVAQERKRCAKLCETSFLVGASEFREAYHAAGIVLAAAIREQP